MELTCKPDFDEAAKRWVAFWQGEVIDRPCLYIVAPRDGVKPAGGPGQLAGLQLGYRKAAEIYEEYAATRVFLAEAVPFLEPSFGPDQFAAFFGAKLHVAPDGDKDTDWVEPFVENWDNVLPLKFDERNRYWQDMLEFIRAATEYSEGKFIIGQLDYHGNMDCLSAIRTPDRLALDLVDRPDTIERALAEVRPYFGIFYDAVYEAGKMRERGTIGWTPFYCRGRFATLQCDFICMISPDMARRFVIPALEEEAAHVDHSTYHFDGPTALQHVEAICGIKDIDVIQWVEGAGHGRHINWIDLLKRFQSFGKGLEVHGTVDEVKALHRELMPEKVLYVVEKVTSEGEGRELIEWFRRNT